MEPTISHLPLFGGVSRGGDEPGVWVTRRLRGVGHRGGYTTVGSSWWATHRLPSGEDEGDRLSPF